MFEVPEFYKPFEISISAVKSASFYVYSFIHTSKTTCQFQEVNENRKDKSFLILAVSFFSVEKDVQVLTSI